MLGLDSVVLALDDVVLALEVAGMKFGFVLNARMELYDEHGI